MTRGKRASGSSKSVEPEVKELEQSVKRLQALMDEAPIGICNIDLKGKVTYVNKRFEEASGYSREEVVGKSGFKLGVFSGETVKLLAKRMKDRLMGRPPRLHELRFKCKDGHWIWVSMEGKFIRRRGIPVGFQLISRDITERKQAEEALRESQEQLQKMFESVSDGISVIDLNGVITEANQRTVEIHGFGSKDELLGKSAFDLIASRDYDRIVTNMRKALKQRTISGVEYTLLKADGTEFPGELSTSVLKDASGNWVGHITIVRDITKRKQAEEQLRESERYLKALFNATAGGILVIEPETHKIVDANSTVIKMIGLSESQIIGHVCHRFVCPAEEGECPITDLKQRVDTSERILLKANGEEIPVLKSVVPITRHGRRYLLELVVDITERKRMEEELKEAQEQLIGSERMTAIGQLASGVGHELRNPLGAIKNAVLYVRRRIAKSELLAYTEPKVLEFLDIIDEEVNNANKVISDLLSFSRVTKPTVSLVKVGSIISDALKRVTMPENVKLTVDVDPSLPMVMVDAVQIRQVFINIILNALEAMPEGGRLEIKARSKAEFVTVEFADTGCGIPESVRGKIFDPLFTTKPKGIGLGLAMSKSIMERHGGDIGVRSKEGKGTTLTLSLPTGAV